MGFPELAGETWASRTKQNLSQLLDEMTGKMEPTGNFYLVAFYDQEENMKEEAGAQPALQWGRWVEKFPLNQSLVGSQESCGSR